MEITRDLLRDLRSQIQTAIADIGSSHGISLVVGNASYSRHDFHFKLEGAVLDIGDGRPAAAADWDKYRNRFGLDGVEFGSTFHRDGIQYTITGIKPKSRKYPVLAADLNGKVYKFPAATVRSRVAA